MSKEVNGSYSDYDRQWLEMIAGKRDGELSKWDNLLSNAMANRILDRIAELEQFVAKQDYCPNCLQGLAFTDFGRCPDCEGGKR